MKQKEFAATYKILRIFTLLGRKIAKQFVRPAKEKLEIVASLSEAKTAKEPGRIKFAEMLSLIEKGKADGIISWHPDRLARKVLSNQK